MALIPLIGTIPPRRDVFRPAGATGDATNRRKGSAYGNGVAWDVARDSRYLHDFLAALKRTSYLDLVERWAGDHGDGALFQTDLFEEAMGEDALRGELSRRKGLVVGMDISRLASGLRWRPLERLTERAFLSLGRYGETRWRGCVGCFAAATTRRPDAPAAWTSST